MTARVAVVIPTKERPAELTAAIDSVRGQTFPDWELWVVDDGSTPAVSLDAVASSDARIHVVRHETSQGPAAARNTGVSRSTAPLIAFLDDDDVWLPRKLEAQLRVLEAAPDDTAAVECGYDLYEGSRLRFRYEPLAGDRRAVLLYRPCLQPSTILVRRSAFEAVGGFDPGLERTEDWIFALEIAERFEIATEPDPLVRRASGDRDPDAMLRGYRSFVAALGERIESLPVAEGRRLRAHHLAIEASYMLDLGRVEEARQRLREAWRLDPRSWRTNMHLARSYLGSRAWDLARRIGYAAGGGLARVRGSAPVLVRRW